MDTCLGLIDRDSEDWSFTLADELAFLEYNLGICVNVNISLSIYWHLC